MSFRGHGAGCHPRPDLFLKNERLSPHVRTHARTHTHTHAASELMFDSSVLRKNPDDGLGSGRLIPALISARKTCQPRVPRPKRPSDEESFDAD